MKETENSFISCKYNQYSDQSPVHQYWPQIDHKSDRESRSNAAYTFYLNIRICISNHLYVGDILVLSVHMRLYYLTYNI